jgi:hypothetical protein
MIENVQYMYSIIQKCSKSKTVSETSISHKGWLTVSWTNVYFKLGAIKQE